MKNSWQHFFRRVAAVCVVGAASAWSSALCYAQLASDSATDPVYADGWQAGDNGGFGFEPWNFDGSYTDAIHDIDSTSQFNNIGTAWRLAFDTDGLPRAGRGFEPLAAGETLRMVIDNPTSRVFFKGYIIRFSTGGGNICVEGAPCTPGTMPKERLGVYVFEYGTNGRWLTSDLADDNFQTPLTDVDTAMAGMQIDLTFTGPETYELVMDPLGTAATYTQSGSLRNTGAGSIDWLEFVFFNTSTDPAEDTDFYVKSIEILGDAPSVAGDYNNNGIVDAADYVIWRKNLGQSFQLTNEVAGVTPGMVTTHDYDAWRSRFGSASGSGSAGIAATAPEPSAMVVLMAGLTATFVVARRRFSARGSKCIIAVTLLTGCEPDAAPPAVPAQSLPAIRGLPVNMTVKQRTTTVVPGSAEGLRVTIDDITAGQVMVSLSDKQGAGVLASASLKQGETAEFKFQQENYRLTLDELNNALVGEDFATFVISEKSPSPALPVRGRESEEATEALPARTSASSVDPGRESEGITERQKEELTEALPARARESEETTEREEIERLLTSIESAEGDVFIRNGAEHAAKDAAEHLRSKWQAAGEQVKTPEEFIDKIATKSSLSGEAYRVRRADGTEVLASDYLREKLSDIENRQPAVE